MVCTALAAQISRAEFPEQKLLDLIAGETSGKICLETIRDLSVLCKWYGSDDMRKGAEFLAERSRRYGLDEVRVEQFPVDTETYYFMQKPWTAWNCTEGELRMISPKHGLITSYEANAPCILVNSRDADITAEVVYVGEGIQDSDYSGKDIKGKLVLAWGRPWKVGQAAIFRHGAAGVLCSWGIDVSGRSSDEIYQTPLPPISEDGAQTSTFGFFLSTDQGRDILKLLEQGEKVVMQAHVRAEVRIPGYHYGVTAVIPGSEFPEEEIVFTAHLDHPRPGSHDNNSGCALLLETARTLASLISQGLIEPPKRTIRFYWTPHVWGVDMFYSQHPEKLPGAVAGINVDCVGLDQMKFSSAFTLVHTPFSRASFLDDIASYLLEYLIRSNHNHMGQLAFGSPLYDHDGGRGVFHAREVPYMDYSDHVFFNSGSVGVPAVTFIDLPFGSHHSQNDKFEMIDPTQLRRISFLAAALSYTIAAAGPEEAFSIADEIYHRGRARLEQDARLAGNVLLKSTPENLPVHFRTAVNVITEAVKREERALHSVRLFAGQEDQALAYIEEKAARILDAEAGLKADLEAVYERCCRLAGQPASQALFSKIEKSWAAIIPCRNPALKGTFGILNRPGEKYAYDPFSPMHAFLYELLNLMDGQRSLLDIAEAVRAQSMVCNYPTFSVEEIELFLDLLKKDGVITFQDDTTESKP